MKKAFIISLLILSCGLADNFSDNQDVNPVQKVCPDCEEVNCIYQEINDNVKGEPTDTNIYQSVMKVVNKRGIKDTAAINNILSNYYL